MHERNKCILRPKGAMTLFALWMALTPAVPANSQSISSSKAPGEIAGTKIGGPQEVGQIAHANALVNRAIELKGRKDMVYARELVERAHNIVASATGHDSVEVAMFLAELGTIDAQLRNLDKAIAELESARRLMPRDPDSESQRNVLAIESNLAWCYRHQQRYEIAEQTYKQLLSEYESKLRTKEPEYAITLISIGNLYVDWDRLAPALDCFTNARNILKGIVPDNHPYVAAWAVGLARYHMARKDFAAAESNFRRALPIMRDNETVPYSKYAEAMRDFFQCLRQADKLELAPQFWTNDSVVIERCLGEEHPTVKEIRGMSKLDK